MRKVCQLMTSVLLLALPLFAQEKRLWVLREPGEMVEYDLTTFARKEPGKGAAPGAEIARKPFSESARPDLAGAVDDSSGYRGGRSRSSHRMAVERASCHHARARYRAQE